MLYANIPGGARWRFVWGSTVGFCLLIQFITGICLWLGYSPSVQSAWESVNYLQTEVTGGWLLRGLHHYTAQILPVMLALHLMQVVIDGAYRAPREVNFWVGLLLLQVVLFLALTGYQLPWDQKGFLGDQGGHEHPRHCAAGGSRLANNPHWRAGLRAAYADAVLWHSRGGAASATLLGLIVVYFCLFSPARSFAGKLPESGHADGPFWPDQALKNAVACLAVMATLLVLILRHRIFSTPGPLGAELTAPADPSEPYSAARPEWYFLFLFQFLLNIFRGRVENRGRADHSRRGHGLHFSNALHWQESDSGSASMRGFLRVCLFASGC